MSVQEARRLFTEIAALPDEEIDLAEAALVIAQEEYPDLDRSHYHGLLDRLASRAYLRFEGISEPYTIVNTLSEFLFDEEGFRGNETDYYEPRNSFLNDVLDRKLGIPITLSLVYCVVAQRLGLPVVGVGMPGHFVVKYVARDEEIMIDPFHRGMILDEDDCADLVERTTGGTTVFNRGHLAAIGARDFLTRMLNNLKGIYLREQDYPRTLRVVERLTIVHPGSLSDIRERGLLRYRVGDLPGAISDLEDYLNDSRATADISLRQFVDSLRRRTQGDSPNIP
jgi:regulator of sirC expression with transglutaminase-like and TPR domain